MRRLPLALIVLVLAACGGSDSASPTAPSVSATSVTVTLGAPVIAATKTTTAIGTAALTNGQSVSVTTGWQSDVPSVATVTPAGVVSGVSNGRANIYVVHGGRQGLAQIRVVPNFAGSWRGSYVIRDCTQTGSMATIGFCNTFRVGTVLPVTMSFSQSAEFVTGTFQLGSVDHRPSTESISEEGRLVFAANPSTSPGTLVVATGWGLTAITDGRLAGFGIGLYSIAGLSGEGRLNLEVLDLTRTAGGRLADTDRRAPPVLNTLDDAMRALSGR